MTLETAALETPAPAPAHAGRPPFLELAGISKRYGGTTALDDVHFSAARGSIHAVLGENGAGKSTLMKTLVGVVRPDSGELRLAGEPVVLDGPAAALAQGIVCVFQELSLVPHLTVAENICLARPARGRSGLIDSAAQLRAAHAALNGIDAGHGIDVRERCADLPLSKRQLVEIAKATVLKPRVLILDEATSALTADDADKVIRLLRRLRDQGCCVLFISHRMHEIDALADTCSVFRNGRHVSTFAAGTKRHADIVAMMIGRPLGQAYPPRPSAAASAEPATSAAPALPYLDVRGLRWQRTLKGVALQVGLGDIVGIGGLDGQGQRELLLALGGLLLDVSAESIRIGAADRLPDSPRVARDKDYRIALIPEDRKTEGLLLSSPVASNLSLACLDRLARLGVIRIAAEAATVAGLVSTLQIKAPDPSVAVATLSGGNQQKVVLAKWLATDPRLLLLTDPTRGVDVGTRQEIYRLLRKLADEGLAILLYSTDCDELIGLCDRVLVMYDGRVGASLSGDELTEQNILTHAMNLGTGDRTPPTARAAAIPVLTPAQASGALS